MKKILLFISLFFIGNQLIAQDKIYKLKGPEILAKVIEIGIDDIKFVLYSSPDGPVYVVEKSSLNRIEFADGRVEKYKLSFKDPENYTNQLSKSLEINFLAPLLGYTQISFEKSLTPLSGYEVGIGIIGAGKNNQIDYYNYNDPNTSYKRNAFGGFLDGGYKFNKLPNFLSRNARMTHIMQGTYVKPTATIGYYTDHALSYKTGGPKIEKRINLFGSVILNFGHQWVFGEKFLIDIYYGLGYAFDNVKEDDSYYINNAFNHFAIQKAGPGANLGLSGGIKAGFLIK